MALAAVSLPGSEPESEQVQHVSLAPHAAGPTRMQTASPWPAKRANSRGDACPSPRRRSRDARADLGAPLRPRKVEYASEPMQREPAARSTRCHSTWRAPVRSRCQPCSLSGPVQGEKRRHERSLQKVTTVTPHVGNPEGGILFLAIKPSRSNRPIPHHEAEDVRRVREECN